jgi:hypothetical protein
MKDDNNKLYIVAFVAIVAIMALAYMFNPSAITTSTEKIKLNSDDVSCDMIITKVPTDYENLGYTCTNDGTNDLNDDGFYQCAKCIKESNTVGLSLCPGVGGNAVRKRGWLDYLVIGVICPYPR